MPTKEQETDSQVDKGQNVYAGTSLGLQIHKQVISFHFLTREMETETVTPTAGGRYQN